MVPKQSQDYMARDRKTVHLLKQKHTILSNLQLRPELSTATTLARAVNVLNSYNALRSTNNHIFASMCPGHPQNLLLNNANGDRGLLSLNDEDEVDDDDGVLMGDGGGSFKCMWEERCAFLESRVSSLEKQLEILVNSSPFDKVAILNSNLECIRASKDCKILAPPEDNNVETDGDIGVMDTDAMTVTIEASASEFQATKLPDHLVLLAKDHETSSGKTQAWVSEMPSPYMSVLLTECVEWVNDARSERGYVLLGRASQAEAKSPSKSFVDKAQSMAEDAVDKIADKSADIKLNGMLDSKYLFDLIPQIVFIANAEGITEYCNEYWYKVTGVSRGDPDEFNWCRALVPEDAAKSFAGWRKAVAEGAAFRSEHRLIDVSTNSTRWYLCRALPLRDKSGRISRWFGTCTDVHDVKMAQRELTLTQQRSDAVVANCCATLWAVDMEGIFTFYNGLTASKLGLTASERIGQSYYQVNKDRPEAIHALNRSLAGETTKVEIELNGLWYETSYSPLFEGNRTIIGCVGVTMDVTERKTQALELLKWERVFYNSRCGMSIGQPGGTFLVVNPAFAEMHGGKVDDYVGDGLRELIADKDTTMMGEMCRRFGETGHITYEAKHKHKKGFIFPVLGDLTSVCDTQGKIVFTVGSFIDLTESKRAEEERAMLEIKEQSAIQASELKSKFLAMMSHEIRTPLNGIIGMLDLACDTVQITEERHYLLTARQSASSLLAIISDILDLSKIEAGKLVLENIDLDLFEVMREVIAMLSFAAREKGVLLEYQTPSLGQCFIKGDPVRLRQVFTNLISNAIKFTNRGRIMVVIDVVHVADAKRKKVIVSVQDTGIGISPEAIPTLFEPFSQADHSTTRKFGGTGLGLSISKQLITLMDGEVFVESTVGSGSKFWFSVEFDDGDFCNIEQSPTAQGPTLTKCMDLSPRECLHDDGSPIRILVVDDNRVNQVVTSKLLQKLGYETACAGNGIEAVAAVHSHSFAVVLMDCHMPEMDGYEATRQIRQSECAHVRKLPIIALTANALVGERDKCLGCGMDDYLCKPVSKASLATTVSRWTNPQEERQKIVLL